MLKKQTAFTLIELLVSLSVFAILVGIAMPSFQTQVANNRTLVLAEELVGAINFARTEAVKRGRAVTFCPINTAKNGCGSDWKNGWFVVVDTAAAETTKPPLVADADAILKRWEKPNSAAVLTVANSRAFVRFNGTGTLARTETTAVTITEQVGKCTQDSARVIKVSVAGMITTERSTCL